MFDVFDIQLPNLAQRSAFEVRGHESAVGTSDEQFVLRLCATGEDAAACPGSHAKAPRAHAPLTLRLRPDTERLRPSRG